MQFILNSALSCLCAVGDLKKEVEKSAQHKVNVSCICIVLYVFSSLYFSQVFFYLVQLVCDTPILILLVLIRRIMYSICERHVCSDGGIYFLLYIYKQSHGRFLFFY